jgi:uncharacterized Tic20 family protein
MENGEPIELEEVSKSERTWAAAGHWTAMLGIIPLPFANIVGPLVVFGHERETSEFVAYHAKQSFYLQAALEVVMVVVCLLTLVAFGLIGSLLGLGSISQFMTYVVILLWWLLRLAVSVAYALIAGIKVFQGSEFEYIFFGDLAKKY